MRGKGGFTLIELLVVIIILGVLAALAIPRYLTTVEKAKATMAFQVINATKSDFGAQYSAYGEYNAANLSPSVGSYAPLTGLLANTTGADTHELWNYNIQPLEAGAAYTINAIRTAESGGTVGQYIQLDQDGVYTGNHSGKP